MMCFRYRVHEMVISEVCVCVCVGMCGYVLRHKKMRYQLWIQVDLSTCVTLLYDLGLIALSL